MAKPKYPPHPAIIEHPDGSITTYSKRCAWCKTTKLYDEFPPYSRARDGRGSWCHECQRSYVHEKRAARRVEGLCIEFGCSERAAPDRSRCAGHLAAERARYAVDPERHRESTRARYARRAVRTAAEVEADRQRLRPDGVKQCRTCGKTLDLGEFHEDRTTADGLDNSCRRCAIKSVARRRSDARARLLARWEERDLFTCTFCGGECEHIEHLLARRNGGPDVSQNLAPACARCNSEKYVTHVDVWLDRLADEGDPRGVVREVWESWPRVYLAALEDGTVVNVATGEVVEEGDQ